MRRHGRGRPRGTVARRVAWAQQTHDDAVREARVGSARDEARIAAAQARYDAALTEGEAPDA